MSNIGNRRFSEELVAMVGRRVSVLTGDGKQYSGDLLGIDEKLNLILSSVIGAESSMRVVLNGSFVREIDLLEKPFDLRALNERLAKAFPGMTKLERRHWCDPRDGLDQSHREGRRRRCRQTVRDKSQTNLRRICQRNFEESLMQLIPSAIVSRSTNSFSWAVCVLNAGSFELKADRPCRANRIARNKDFQI